MSTENRSVTLVPWPGPDDRTATPPELQCPRYTDLNHWQDYGCRAMSLDGTMEPAAVGFEDIEGCLKVYGQSASIASGGAIEIFTIRNWRTVGIPDEYDLTSRVIECTVWTENNAVELPTGVNYDPDTFLNAPVSHVWFTGNGAADGNPPVGTFWTPWANIHIYCGDANNPTSFRCYNNTGSAVFLVFMGTFTQQITV